MILQGDIWHCTVQHYTTWYCMVMHYLVLSCNVLHYSTLPCTNLQYRALAGTNLHYRQLSSNILYYLAQQQTSIFRQSMVCYANVRHMIEVKSHVNVCHVTKLSRKGVFSHIYGFYTNEPSCKCCLCKYKVMKLLFT